MTIVPAGGPGTVHPALDLRPRVEGKFLFVGDRKLTIRGVTYGPLGPEGREFGTPREVERDFRLMRRLGANALRTYSVPPRWLLDRAAASGLRVLVGLAWEQHVAFLEDQALAERIRSRVRQEVRRVAGHPAILCYALGNEIPAPIVRWHGGRRVAGFLEELWRAAREEDPEGLFTYVNYPTTEYLSDLPFLDLLSFNVYLEQEGDFRSYLARLQNLAGERPLLMAELGLDAGSHGEEVQARSLAWQVHASFEAGCAGAFVFSWTDRWYRGGEEIRDWSFGITNRDRRPKPAFHAVGKAFRAENGAAPGAGPTFSVVVCSYNGARTIGETLEHLDRLRYRDYEVIVVDDGSTDGTAEIAARHAVRLIRTPNRGLSSARNTGLEAAWGEIVAYIDDDAFPDPDWLTFLAIAFQETDHAAVGGPNLPPPDEGFVARAVARAPGGPIHVLLSDTEAEHLPGCNLAIRADRLRQIGGFDPRFRVAGDDVDVCWRLQDAGYTLGFSPGAVVWHRRRGSVAAYWRQQKGYGRAEAMLERKWPEKYNAVGHVSWSGRLYDGSTWGLLPGGRRRIYHGTWGTAPFQSLEDDGPGPLEIAVQLPESWLFLAILASVGALGAFWSPLYLGFVLAMAGSAALVGRTVASAWKVCRTEVLRDRGQGLRLAGLTALLHLLHPMARLAGRVSEGLAPWRRYVPARVSFGADRTLSRWSESWRSQDGWVRALEEGLRHRGLLVRRGGAYDRWDLEVRSGALTSVRLLVAVEEHGQGRQLGRFRLEPRYGSFAQASLLAGAGLGLAAVVGGAWFPAVALGGAALLVLFRCMAEHVAAVDRTRAVVGSLWSAEPAPVTEDALDRIRTLAGPSGGNGASPHRAEPRLARSAAARGG
jgi:O-antigen biosynthesis protein